MAKNKVVTVEEAMKHCFNGMTVLLPGFVNVGVPEVLIDGLIEAGITDLKVISNNTSVKGRGIGKLVHENRIKHITCSHIGNNTETVEKVVAGEIDITFTPQGTLCERVRAGGAGLGGILTPTGLGTSVVHPVSLLTGYSPPASSPGTSVIDSTMSLRANKASLVFGVSGMLYALRSVK